MSERVAEPIITVRGQQVGLGPVRRSDLPLFQRWLSDPAVTRTLSATGPFTLEAEEQWLDHLQKDPRTVVMTIFELASGRPVGNTGLHHVDHRQRTAIFGIFIGDRQAWGKGYGTEATRLMLDFAFSVLNLHNVMLTVYSNNTRAIRAYEKAGFKTIGRRREARRIGGAVFDEILMDILATELESPVLRRVVLAGDDRSE